MSPQTLAIPLLQAGAVAFLLTVLTVGLLVPWAGRLRLLDYPGGHKGHHRPVPLVGGVAIFVGVSVASHAFAPPIQPIWPMTLAGGWMLLVGLADDRHDIKPITRLLNQLALAVLLVGVTGFRLDTLGDPLGMGEIRLGWMGAPLAILAAVALTNAFNMLDGLDGIAAGVAVTTFVAIMALAVEDQRWIIAVSSAAMVGALVGFLLFNLPFAVPRKHLVFMGDAGSTMIGMLAAIALLCLLIQGELGGGWSDPAGVDAHIMPVELLWLVAIPVFEIVTSTARRLRQGLSPFRADNGHYHHRLRQANWRVRVIFVFYVAFSVATMLVGLSLHHSQVAEHLVLLGFLAAYGLFHGIIATAARHPFPAYVPAAEDAPQG
ncbi:MAG: glycosyltransferase family 4 protein [Steroidobacteraceae bacterium]